MLDDVLPNFLPCYVSKKPNQPHAKPALEEGNEKDDILIKKKTKKKLLIMSDLAFKKKKKACLNITLKARLHKYVNIQKLSVLMNG